jgi:valyl-tRNA synthetase
MELAASYLPSEIESKWYQVWEEQGYFKPNMDPEAPSYCIQLPPPNVTGTLHMGHAFQQTVMDILIRYHRMRGYNTLWQPGTDHAGIATQIVVERQLDSQGTSRHDLGRDEFMKKVWEWKEYSGSTITQQMRRLGASCDWSRERFTMDEGLSAAVSQVFISLYQKGYIYRGKRLVNWDIKLQTAVSDLEVVSEEENGNLWYIRYPVKGRDDSLVVATTRPETMLGDVAVAVNPEDPRYKHLVGEKLLLPLVGREIPIISDEYVDADFGTGCVKITPAHDFNDYEIGKRHNLPMINILTLDGHINHQAPQQYQGLERFAARKQIVTDLEQQGYLESVKPHKLMVPRGDRTNVIIEPMLTDQWFMKMDDFAKRGLELVESGKIRFVPENWKKTYDQWLTNIQDWCISRQLWWGHRIPAYYDENGQVYVAASLAEAQQLANTSNLRQDNDVLDTWFSSALWSFSTLGWPNSTSELAAFLPSSVLVTGFDIIFFWVARMIMLTEEFTGEVPFRDIYINGLIMDAHGNKMSKSKGNVIDPLDIIDGISIEELVGKRTANLMNPKQAETIAKQTRKDYPQGFLAFGADALRFALASLATQARYINFDLKRIEGSRNFCNKLFNASKFVLMQVGKEQDLIGSESEPGTIDRWILAELATVISDVTTAFATYRFDLACSRIYEFVWNEFCDWYLELAKVNLQADAREVRAATLNTLLTVLECVLRLIHPVMPFISEEIWQVLAPLANLNTKPSIMLAEFPQPEKYLSNKSAAASGEIKELKQVIGSIRNLRAEMNLAPALKVPLLVATTAPEFITTHQHFIAALAKVSQVSVVAQFVEENAPIAVLNNLRLMLQVEVDVAAERTRLTKELDKQVQEMEKLEQKLANPNYRERAPQQLVARDQARVAELTAVAQQLQSQLAKLGQ